MSLPVLVVTLGRALLYTTVLLYAGSGKYGKCKIIFAIPNLGTNQLRVNTFYYVVKMRFPGGGLYKCILLTFVMSVIGYLCYFFHKLGMGNSFMEQPIKCFLKFENAVSNSHNVI